MDRFHYNWNKCNNKNKNNLQHNLVDSRLPTPECSLSSALQGELALLSWQCLGGTAITKKSLNSSTLNPLKWIRCFVHSVQSGYMQIILLKSFICSRRKGRQFIAPIVPICWPILGYDFEPFYISAAGDALFNCLCAPHPIHNELMKRHKQSGHEKWGEAGPDWNSGNSDDHPNVSTRQRYRH